MMKVGIDVLEIRRMKRLLGNSRFMRRVFSPYELEYIQKKGIGGAATAAGLFCAKEAYFKALGIGIGAAVLSETEIRHDAAGRPYISGASVSITHTRETAAAVVIIES